MTPARPRGRPPADDMRSIPCTWRRTLAALFLSCACSLVPAHAEKADRDKPIHLEADRVTVDDAKHVATFEGHVVLTQGTMTIRGDRMEVTQDNQGFRHGVAWGNPAYFRQKRDGSPDYVEGWAQRIEYDGRSDKVQLFTHAIMKRGPDEVRGDYISYDAATEFFQVIGGGTKAATTANPEGRVRAVIHPQSKTPPPRQPPVELKPSGSMAAPREEPRAPAK